MARFLSLSIPFISLALAIQLTVFFSAPKHQEPGEGCIWSTPINISVSPENHTLAGAAIGDHSGFVHAFWTEKTDAQQGDVTNYIVYRVWEGQRWSAPSDILVATGVADAWVADVALSPDQDRLYLLWTDGSGVNVSSADRHRATDAKAWYTVRVAAGGTLRPALTVDDQGNIHVIYTDYLTGSNVMRHIESEDGGATWSPTTDVWTTADTGLAFDYAKLVAGQSGILHAAWQVGERDKDWLPFTVLYTHSMDGGMTWTEPMGFQSYERGYANPELLEDSQGRLHLFMNGAAGTLDGHFYVWSDNAGQTWSPVQPLVGYPGGRSGFPRLAADSTGTLHVVMGSGLQDPGSSAIVISSFLAGSSWTPPTIVATNETGGFSGDAPALAITGGNQLHVFVWTQQDPAEILYSTCLLPIPTLTPVPTPVYVAQALPTIIATQTTLQATVSPTPNIAAVSDKENARAQASPQYRPVVLGAILSGALVLTVVVFSMIGTNRLRR